MATPIRRNKDGRQNLVDLRKALESNPGVRVHSQGGQWIICRTSSTTDCWHETPAPYWCDERAAIQLALFGEIESKEEAHYRTDKASHYTRPHRLKFSPSNRRIELWQIFTQ